MIFYGKELLALHSTHKLENNPLSAVCDCLFNTVAPTLHIWRSSPPSRTQGHAMLRSLGPTQHGLGTGKGQNPNRL